MQNKGSLITQKHRGHKGGAEMIVWVSEDGLSTEVQENGIVFAEADDAYAAIRVLKGTYEWSNGSITYEGKDSRTKVSPPGKMMVLEDAYSPVIVGVMAQSDIVSL